MAIAVDDLDTSYVIVFLALSELIQQHSNDHVEQEDGGYDGVEYEEAHGDAVVLVLILLFVVGENNGSGDAASPAIPRCD